VLATGANPYYREERLTALHDPAFGVRRILWLAYAVLGIALVFFVATVFMLRDHRSSGTRSQPPPAASASAAPALTQDQPAAAPSGQPDRAQTAGSGGRLTRTGGTPGEPPGDIEDDPRGGSGSASAGSAPSGGGILPPLSVPKPAVPTVPPSVVPRAAPSALPSVLPTPLF
jgi:hypothetical protein